MADEIIYVVLPPDGGWGWVVVACAFFTNFMVDGTIYTFGLFLGDLAKHYNKPESALALANSVLCATYYLTGKVRMV